MPVQQQGEPQRAEVGQKLKVVKIGESVGFCDASLRGTPLFFVIVPYHAIVTYPGGTPEVEFCQVNRTSPKCEEYNALVSSHGEFVRLDQLEGHVFTVKKLPPKFSAETERQKKKEQAGEIKNEKPSHPKSMCSDSLNTISV